MSHLTEDQIKTITAGSSEPTVVAEILKKLNSISSENELLKENFDKLNRELHSARETENIADPLAKNKTNKEKEAVLTRQEVNDLISRRITAMNDRIDSIDVYSQRPNDSYQLEDTIDLTLDEKDQLRFFSTVIADNKPDKKSNIPTLKKDMPKVTMDQLNEYREAFVHYVLGHYNMREEKMRKFMACHDDISVAFPQAAGWLVPPVIAQQIKVKEREMDPILNYVGKLTITMSDTYKVFVDYGEPEAQWRGTERSPGDLTAFIPMQEFEAPIHEIYKKLQLTTQALEDIPAAERLIGDHAGKAIAFTEAQSIIRGTGVKEPMGILSYDDGTNYGEVERINIGATLGYDGIMDLMYAMPEYAFARPDVRVFVNRATMREIFKIKDLQERPLWQQSLIAGQPSTIHGKPIEMSASIPTIGVDAPVMLIGAWGEAYIFIERRGITIFRNEYQNYPMVIIDVSKRMGGGVIMPDYIKIGVSND